MKILCVMSGGLDSAVATAFLHELHPMATFGTLHFDYGSVQAPLERMCVAFLSGFYRHAESFYLSLRDIRGSLLTSGDPIPMPEDVPPTYVPARNLILIAQATATALLGGYDRIVFGIHDEDSPYPDCTKEFVEAMQEAVFRGTAGKVTLSAPLMGLTKVDIVNLGNVNHVPFKHTWTCYFPVTLPAYGEEKGVYFLSEKVVSCGECDACQTRLAAFGENGLVDPLEYAPGGDNVK